MERRVKQGGMALYKLEEMVAYQLSTELKQQVFRLLYNTPAKTRGAIHGRHATHAPHVPTVHVNHRSHEPTYPPQVLSRGLPRLFQLGTSRLVARLRDRNQCREILSGGGGVARCGGCLRGEIRRPETVGLFL